MIYYFGPFILFQLGALAPKFIYLSMAKDTTKNGPCKS